MLRIIRVGMQTAPLAKVSNGDKRTNQFWSSDLQFQLYKFSFWTILFKLKQTVVDALWLLPMMEPCIWSYLCSTDNGDYWQFDYFAFCGDFIQIAAPLQVSVFWNAPLQTCSHLNRTWPACKCRVGGGGQVYTGSRRGRCRLPGVQLQLLLW